MKTMVRKLFALALALALTAGCLPALPSAAGETHNARYVRDASMLIPGARYVIECGGWAGGHGPALAGFTSDGTALATRGIPDGFDYSWLDGLTDDYFFVLDSADGEQWTITTPDGKDIAPMPLDEDGGCPDGLTESAGFLWTIRFDDGVIFAPCDPAYDVELAVDARDDTVYAAHYTGGAMNETYYLITWFNLYICDEDAGVYHDAYDHATLIGEAEVSISEVVCGTTIQPLPEDYYDFDYVGEGEPDYNNMPGVTAPENDLYWVHGAYWVVPSDDGWSDYVANYEEISVRGGEKYYVWVDLCSSAFVSATPDMFGPVRGETGGDVYGAFTADTVFTAEGAELAEYHLSISMEPDRTRYVQAVAVFEVTAVHDWGDWVVTTEPTATEPGEETRVCRGDPSHVETRPIDPTGVPETGDAGGLAKWMSLSAMSLAALYFVRKRRNV